MKYLVGGVIGIIISIIIVMSVDRAPTGNDSGYTEKVVVYVGATPEGRADALKAWRMEAVRLRGSCKGFQVLRSGGPAMLTCAVPALP